MPKNDAIAPVDPPIHWGLHGASTACKRRKHLAGSEPKHTAKVMTSRSWISYRSTLLLLVCLGCTPAQRMPIRDSAANGSTRNFAAKPAKQHHPRNVILLLADGTGPEAYTLARWVKGKPLAVDSILTGAIRTYGADSIITDSAPGATAYATGYKGTDKAISIGAFHSTIDQATVNQALAYVPLPTLLEGAKLRGYATGLVATSNIQHATPAAFSSHVRQRSQYDSIAKQQVFEGIDVVLSGGWQHLLPNTVSGGVRIDGADLTQALRTAGYQYVTTQRQLSKAQPGRLWGLFAPNELAYEIDRERFAPDQPSLADMTEQAILRLSQSDAGKAEGFFLFVEGSKVDWAAHGNDPVGVVSELLAFDDSVRVALQFAKSNDTTQVIVVEDHGTGGITIGNQYDPNYSTTDDDAVTGPLRAAKVTAETLAQLLKRRAPSESPADVIAREWRINDLPTAELTELSDKLANNESPANTLSRIISRRARIGWTTYGHTGVDVYLFAYGPEHPQGLLENTAIGQGIARYLGINLAELQDRLFVDLTTNLLRNGFDVRLEEQGSTGGQLRISGVAREATLPFDMNVLRIDDKPLSLEGLVLYSPELKRVFGPAQALQLVQKALGTQTTTSRKGN